MVEKKGPKELNELNELKAAMIKHEMNPDEDCEIIKNLIRGVT